jgi:hypothetical protein
MIAAGVLLGIFTMCNFWDLVIYFAVAGLILLLANLRGYGSIAGWESIPVFTLQMLLILFPFLAASSPAVALALYAVAFAGCCLLTLLSADALTLAGAQLAFLFLLSNLVSLPFIWRSSRCPRRSRSRPTIPGLFQLIMLWVVHAGLGGPFSSHAVEAPKGRPDPLAGRGRRARAAVRLLLGIRPADLFACGIFCAASADPSAELGLWWISTGVRTPGPTHVQFTYQALCCCRWSRPMRRAVLDGCRRTAGPACTVVSAVSPPWSS